MTDATQEAEVDVTRDENDPFGGIIEAEARQFREELETMRQQAEAGEETPSPDPTSEPPDADTEATSGAPETGKDGAGKLGIDSALRLVEDQVGEEAAGVFKSVISSHNKTRTEWNQAKDQIAERLAELDEAIASVKGDETPQEETDPALSGIKDSHWDTFRAMARKEGVVLKSELEEQEREAQVKRYVDERLSTGLEQVGDEFGVRDEDGVFHVNEELMEELAAEKDRLYDPNRGPTAWDLFLLARGGVAPKQADLKPVPEPPARVDRVGRARRAMTEQRATSRPAQRQIYSRSKGDTLDDAVQRAASEAFREVS